MRRYHRLVQSNHESPSSVASGEDGPVVVRDAATVVLVRNGEFGIEVFMLRRSLQSKFVGGAYVFPGGAVDPSDHPPDIEHLCYGLNDEQASKRLGIAAGGLAYWVAAVRESFEEAGVLLAVDDSDRLVSFSDLDVQSRFTGWRAGVDSGAQSLRQVCEAEGLRLATDRMHYFSHWITPIGAPRRYDTRFFICGAPPEQVPLHDDRETIANVWIRPLDALERCQRGEFAMILPTIKTLEAIGRFSTASDFLEAASQIGEIPTILPRLRADGELVEEIVGIPAVP